MGGRDFTQAMKRCEGREETIGEKAGERLWQCPARSDVACFLEHIRRFLTARLTWKSSPTPQVFRHPARDEDVLNERYSITRQLGAGFGTVGRRSDHGAYIDSALSAVLILDSRVSVEYKTLSCCLSCPNR